MLLFIFVFFHGNWWDILILKAILLRCCLDQWRSQAQWSRIAPCILPCDCMVGLMILFLLLLRLILGTAACPSFTYIYLICCAFCLAFTLILLFICIMLIYFYLFFVDDDLRRIATEEVHQKFLKSHSDRVNFLYFLQIYISNFLVNRFPSFRSKNVIGKKRTNICNCLITVKR